MNALYLSEGERFKIFKQDNEVELGLKNVQVSDKRKKALITELHKAWDNALEKIGAKKVTLEDLEGGVEKWREIFSKPSAKISGAKRNADDKKDENKSSKKLKKEIR